VSIRSEVSAVLKKPISNVASFAQILEDISRDTGNTQRLMRDLIAVILTNLEEIEKSEGNETITKDEPKSKIRSI